MAFQLLKKEDHCHPPALSIQHHPAFAEILVMVTIRSWYMRRGLTLVLGLTLITGLAGVWSVRHSARTRATERARQGLDRFEGHAASAFHQAEVLAQALAERWSRGNTDLESPQMLVELLPFLNLEGSVTSLMLFDTRKQILFLNRMPEGWKITSHRWSGSSPESFTVGKGAYQLNLTAPHMKGYRAEARPWFQHAVQQCQAAWMQDAYRFPPGVAGFSYIIPIRDEAGVLRAVVGADINLATLSKTLWSMDPAFKHLEVLDPQGRVLLPRWAPGLDSGEATLSRAQLTSPLLSAPVLSMRTMAGAGRPSLKAQVLAKNTDFAWGWKDWGAVVLLPTLAAGLSSVFLFYFQGRVIHPLEHFAESSTAAGTVPLPAYLRIRELDKLDTSIRRGHTAEIRLEELQRQLEHLQRTETLEAMAPGIVHDAKNQLAVAMGNLTLCSDILEGHPELEPYLERARGATMRCSEVLKALLAYSRAEPEAREPLDLNRLVLDSSLLLGGLLGRNIQLQILPDKAMALIFGERIKLEQVILNLSINARDAMPEGGTLTIRTRRIGDEIHLEVEDSGTGMPEEVRARIFEPFFTTKTSGHGTGLGLAMVASIIKAMNGSIKVSSALGQGTTFILAFPAQFTAALAPIPPT